MALVQLSVPVVSEVNDAMSLIIDLVGVLKAKGDTAKVLGDLIKVLGELNDFQTDLKTNLPAVRRTVLVKVEDIVELLVS